MVELLGVPSSVCILIEFLGPACCLMCDESSSGSHEPNCSIDILELTHVAGIPSHFRFCGWVDNDFSVATV